MVEPDFGPFRASDRAGGQDRHVQHRRGAVEPVRRLARAPSAAGREHAGMPGPHWGWLGTAAVMHDLHRHGTIRGLGRLGMRSSRRDHRIRSQQARPGGRAAPGEVVRHRPASHRAPPCGHAGMRDRHDRRRPARRPDQRRRMQVHAAHAGLRCQPGQAFAGPSKLRRRRRGPVQRQAGLHQAKAGHGFGLGALRGACGRPQDGQHRLNAVLRQPFREIDRVAPCPAHRVGRHQQPRRGALYPVRHACSNSRNGTGRPSWISENDENWPR